MIEKVQLNTVKGFEDVKNYYQVFRDGDWCWLEGKNGKVVNGAVDKSTNYIRVGVKNNTNQKNYYQHRLFAMCFIPNPKNKEQVNHNDGCKTNNLLSNLSWVTPSENIQHADRTGLRKCANGDKHGMVKVGSIDIENIFKMRKQGLLLKEIASQYDIGISQVSAILSGKSRKTETFF